MCFTERAKHLRPHRGVHLTSVLFVLMLVLVLVLELPQPLAGGMQRTFLYSSRASGLTLMT